MFQTKQPKKFDIIKNLNNDEEEEYEETFTRPNDKTKTKLIAMLFIEEMKFKIEESPLRKEIFEEKINFIDNETLDTVSYLFKTIYNNWHSKSYTHFIYNLKNR